MERRAVRVLSLLAFAIVLAVDVLYVNLINAQGPSDQPYIPRFVAAYLAVMAAMVAIALLPRPEVEGIRVALRATAAAGLFVLGFVAAFSIGPALVLAGFFVLLALIRTERRPRARVANVAAVLAAALSIVVLLVGLEVTQRWIVCAPGSTDSGAGTTLILGAYHYQCVDGEPRLGS